MSEVCELGDHTATSVRDILGILCIAIRGLTRDELRELYVYHSEASPRSDPFIVPVSLNDILAVSSDLVAFSRPKATGDHPLTIKLVHPDLRACFFAGFLGNNQGD